MKPPLTFRPDPDVADALDRDAASRPGVPRSFLINEALRFALRHSRTQRATATPTKRPMGRRIPTAAAA